MTAVDHFALLEKNLPVLHKLSNRGGPIGYFGQEAMRFYSIAGTLKNSSMLTNSSAEERQINHTLGRSLLEGLVWVLYIFSNPTDRTSRFDEKLDTFRIEYLKLWNEPALPGRAQLEPADAGWKALKGSSVSGLLGKLQAEHGNKLSDLYTLYRIASFDTHGNSMAVLFEEVFGRKCNFSVLDFEFGFDFIAKMYLAVLSDLEAAGEV